MSNCSNMEIANLIQTSKLDKYTEVDFTAMQDIEACAKINTKHFIETHGNITSYSSLNTPQDLFNICETFGCKNTGTRTILGELKEGKSVASGKFSSISDSTKYFAGVVSYYVFLPKEGTYTIDTTISDLKDDNQQNADKYTKTVVAKHGGFYPVSVELAIAPTADLGDGWTATTNGVVINIEIATESKTALSVGISSISLFDSIEDLEGNDAIKLSCLASIDGNDSFTALAEACLAAQLDDSTLELTRDIAFKKYSPNAWKLHPMARKIDVDGGFYMITKNFVVEKDPDNEKQGRIHLQDHFIDECGYIYASLDDTCNITDALLKRINSPNRMTLDERQFQVINTEQNPDADVVGSYLYVDASLVGKTLKVSYPKTADASEQIVYDAKSINKKRYKVTWPEKKSDGTMLINQLNNVLITAFPMDLNTDNSSEKTLSVSIQPDSQGIYIRQTIINREAGLL